jgi:hypothetical protein
VTASRKLVVAAMLLAGGYGLAFVLGTLAELVVPGGGSTPERIKEHGLLTTLKGFALDRGNAPGSSALIPESEFTARPSANQPTWLAATPERNVPATAASQPAFAAALPLGDYQPISPATNVGGAAQASSPSPPKARITNVLAASAESTTRPASPWDRWPRWDSSGAPPESDPVAATFHDQTAANPQAVHAAYSRADVVRKNSPALDSGPAADGGSGRTHVVVDGDSLAKLAARYLDAADLGDDIYRLNRDVLTSGDLLPIGVELRIPDSRMADSTAAFPVSRGFAAATPNIPSGMVPVEWTPKAFDRVPQAELLRPIPARRAE